jgi:hypothetical protein
MNLSALIPHINLPGMCTGGGINWEATLILNVPKYLYPALVFLSFTAHIKKWNRWVQYGIYGLTIAAGIWWTFLFCLYFGGGRNTSNWWWEMITLGCIS